MQNRTDELPPDWKFSARQGRLRMYSASGHFVRGPMNDTPDQRRAYAFQAWSIVGGRDVYERRIRAVALLEEFCKEGPSAVHHSSNCDCYQCRAMDALAEPDPMAARTAEGEAG